MVNFGLHFCHATVVAGVIAECELFEIELDAGVVEAQPTSIKRSIRGRVEIVDV
jgi:hypothetical protein